jgi:5'-nucleotidase
MTFRLLLDMDGPLADFDVHFHDRARALGHEFDVAGPHLQTARYFTDHIVDPWARKEARRMIDSSGWFASLPVTPGAVEGVAQLLDAGVDVWVCTKPLEVNPTCRDEKGAWLREHFPMLERKLIIAPDKSLVRGDVLLDDAPKLDWIGQATWIPVIFAAPFNGAGSEWDGLPRWSWGDPLADLLLEPF